MFVSRPNRHSTRSLQWITTGIVRYRFIPLMALEELGNNGIKISKGKGSSRKKRQWYNAVLGSDLQSSAAEAWKRHEHGLPPFHGHCQHGTTAQGGE